MRAGVRALWSLACLIARHSAAWAQATIAGVVRDASGAVLPGVTVEAAEPGADREGSHGGHATAPAATASRTCGPATTP